jgi:hypothetical protein
LNMDATARDNYVIAMRQTAGSAAFGAALLLFFGFYMLAEPVRDDLFGRSAWVFFHTLRIGGLLTAAIAAWLWTAHRPALLVDSIVAGIIGIIFILTGTGMLIDGGSITQVIINAFCGVLFIRASLLSAAMYRNTSSRVLSEASPTVTPPGISPPSPPTPFPPEQPVNQSMQTESTPPPEGYLASLARKRQSKSPAHDS